MAENNETACLVDLDYLCIRRIFEELSPQDLYSMSQIAGFYMEIAMETFKRQRRIIQIATCRDLQILNMVGDLVEQIELLVRTKYERRGSQKLWNIIRAIIRKCPNLKNIIIKSHMNKDENDALRKHICRLNILQRPQRNVKIEIIQIRFRWITRWGNNVIRRQQGSWFAASAMEYDPEIF